MDYAALRDALTAPPVMSEGKLVEWRYPSFLKMTESECLALEGLIELSAESLGTVLVFLVSDGAVELGTQRRPSKFTKRFGESAAILNFELSSEAQLASWLKKHFAAEGVGVSDEAVRALIARSGRSMTVLNNEVIKLSSYALASGRAVLDTADIAEVASYTSGGEEFALSNAVLAGNAALAYSALMDMKSKRVEPTVIMAMLSRIYSELVSVSELLAEGRGADDIASVLKMNPYKLKLYITAAKRRRRERLVEALDEICRADAAAKFGGLSGYVALELLIGKCL